jgi:hypothetical protein
MVRSGVLALGALAALAFAIGCGPAEAPPRGPEALSAPGTGLQGESSGTAAERFFPLVDGHVYHYVTTTEQGEQGMLVARVHRSGASQGELRFPTGAKRFEYRPEGVVLAGEGAFVLREPIAPGTAWIGEHGGQARVEEVGITAEVPAGRFSGCVRTREERLGDRPLVYLATFCPDVGLVSLEATGGASYEKAELKSYGPPVQIGPDGLERMPSAPGGAEPSGGSPPR